MKRGGEGGGGGKAPKIGGEEDPKVERGFGGGGGEDARRLGCVFVHTYLQHLIGKALLSSVLFAGIAAWRST